jgi:hypothetical protein
VAFKVESHNHPSAVSPYQGAATGVGGIIRDILAMGAWPVACMDGLFFGDPSKEKTAGLMQGVISGIGGYGNAVGVPTVGGKTVFDGCYDGNPLVNAFCAGLRQVQHGKTWSNHGSSRFAHRQGRHSRRGFRLRPAGRRHERKSSTSSNRRPLRRKASYRMLPRAPEQRPDRQHAGHGSRRHNLFGK